MARIAAGTDKGISYKTHYACLAYFLPFHPWTAHALISRRQIVLQRGGSYWNSTHLASFNDCPHDCGRLLRFLNPQSLPSYLPHAPLRTTDGRTQLPPMCYWKMGVSFPLSPLGSGSNTFRFLFHALQLSLKLKQSAFITTHRFCNRTPDNRC